MSQFYILGGQTMLYSEYEDAIQLYQEDGWKTVGHMNVPRRGHAVSVVSFDDVCQIKTTTTANTTTTTATTTTSPTSTPSLSPSINFGYKRILVLCLMILILCGYNGDKIVSP